MYHIKQRVAFTEGQSDIEGTIMTAAIGANGNVYYQIRKDDGKMRLAWEHQIHELPDTDHTPEAAGCTPEPTERLTDILTRQAALEALYGHTYPLGDAELSETVRNTVLALTDELHEVLHETHWKPWANTNGMRNREAYVEELADCMHFFAVLCLAGGVTGAELHEAYVKKNEENQRRIANGYDDVKGKCLRCHADRSRANEVACKSSPNGNHLWQMEPPPEQRCYYCYCTPTIAKTREFVGTCSVAHVWSDKYCANCRQVHWSNEEQLSDDSCPQGGEHQLTAQGW